MLQEINIDTVLTESEFASKVHPTILRLGLGYASGVIRGSNARAVALLTALSQMFQVGTHLLPLPQNKRHHPFFSMHNPPTGLASAEGNFLQHYNSVHQTPVR